jgi:hypothetical protein
MPVRYKVLHIQEPCCYSMIVAFLAQATSIAGQEGWSTAGVHTDGLGGRHTEKRNKGFNMNGCNGQLKTTGT